MSLTTIAESPPPADHCHVVTDSSAAGSQALTATVRDIYRQLADMPSLRPGPQVNSLLRRLVRAVLDGDEASRFVLADSAVPMLAPRLRELCAQAETELERTWAERVAVSSTPHDELSSFPYLDNYRQLCRMEVGVLASALVGTVRSLAFVGAGPLPLSSLLLAGELDVTVDNFDRDPAALLLAGQVCEALGFREFRFRHADAADADLCDYDVVVLAALVGVDPEEKRRVLAHLARSMRPGALLLARSARGLRTLLYPPVEPDMLGGFELLTIVHPVNDVVNSAVLARVRRPGA